MTRDCEVMTSMRVNLTLSGRTPEERKLMQTLNSVAMRQKRSRRGVNPLDPFSVLEALLYAVFAGLDRLIGLGVDAVAAGLALLFGRRRTSR